MVSILVIPASVLLATSLSSRGINVLSDHHAMYIPTVACGVYAGQLFLRTTSRVLKIAQFAAICGLGLAGSVYFANQYEHEQQLQQQKRQLQQERYQMRLQQQFGPNVNVKPYIKGQTPPMSQQPMSKSDNNDAVAKMKSHL